MRHRTTILSICILLLATGLSTADQVVTTNLATVFEGAALRQAENTP